jgi:hypothetical protein
MTPAAAAVATVFPTFTFFLSSHAGKQWEAWGRDDGGDARENE